MSFWPCSSSTNEGLVGNLRKTGVIQSDAVFEAMRRVDRAKYMQDESPLGVAIGPLTAYCDSPHPIGFNQTISAPHMHAHALELGFNAIRDVARPSVLDVGAGSGYLTACLGRLVEDKQGAHVYGLEVISPLAQFAQKNLKDADGDLLGKGIVSIHVGNGWDGLPNDAPFHYIHVGAAAETPPQALMDQLADGGSLVVPLDQERGGQVLVEITRHGNTFSQRRLMNVCYVPLVRPRKPSV
jgi:protein-L-isoaspartate(D-aspartate) O-methyltransferase